MDGSELLRFSRDLKLFWEKVRRHYTTGKLNDHMQARSAPLALKNQRDNEAASELKAKLVGLELRNRFFADWDNRSTVQGTHQSAHGFVLSAKWLFPN